MELNRKDKMIIFTEGKELWQEYININGYAFYPTSKGLEKLSRLLDLNKNYLQKNIGFFLEC